jgi:hypothetical protein
MLLKKIRDLKRYVLGAILLPVFFFSSAEAQPKMPPKNSLNTIQAATPTEDRKYELRWNLGLKADGLEEGASKEELNKSTKILQTKLGIYFDYWLNSSLFFDFQPVARFQSGRNQSLDGGAKTANSIGVYQAAVHWMPGNIFRLSAGSLNQESLHTSLISDDNSYPALRAKIRATPDNWELALVGEASVPTSNNLETNTNEVEATPTKSAAQVQVNWKPAREIFAKTRAGIFSYNNLPSEVAQASSLLGNSTIQVTEDESRFLYDYHGIEAGTDLQIPLWKSLDVLLMAEGAQNQGAPETKNKAYSFGGGVRLVLGSRHDLYFTGRRYSVESDVAPAFFSNRDNFRTNRNGYEAAAKWHLKKQKFAIGLAYSEAQPIYSNAVQSQIKAFQIKLETDDVSL